MISTQFIRKFTLLAPSDLLNYFQPLLQKWTRFEARFGDIAFRRTPREPQTCSVGCNSTSDNGPRYTCVGLYTDLSAYIAQRRTREFGHRSVGYALCSPRTFVKGIH